MRDATPEDAAACAEIYAEHVLGGWATFEVDPPGVAETARRIAVAQQRHAWLVAEEGGRVVGFAYASAFRPRPAYRWTCETTVYLASAATGRGTGRRLYGELLRRLTDRGLLTAMAAVAQPNPASEALHASLGYRRVALLPRAGWKLDGWHDVAWLSRTLGEGPQDGPAPPEPR
ncbi:GNAT family N-acetyltransferase [Pseudokineococcus sp. 1T1Z-3]|uniref:GNAT family N-acetyltransferase n=1 Tax=Pseudokineococcus sp. 1T1Z-3 TaxID=3132745 RepID=UPI0030B62C45